MLAIGPLAGPTKTLVGQATRDNDSPPSGYQLDLLCKASFASPNECDQLFDAIIRRLDSSSANVKWKTLRVISYLCQHGNPSIRKEFQRKIDRIRVCTGFSGALHPLRGDAPNERVRVAAKDALSALFSTPDPQPQYSNSKISHLSGGQSPGLSSEQDSVLGSTFKSVLSSAASLVAHASSSADQFSSYRPSGSSYQITGIGNPSFNRSNSQPSSVLDKMKQVFDPRWKSASVSQPSGYSGLPLGGGPANRGDFDVKPAMLEGVQRRRGQVGGTWADEDSDARLPKAAPIQSHHSELAPSDSQAIHSHDNDVEFGALENRFVQDLTTPGGVTAAPSPEQLSTLLESLQSLDLCVIAELLSQKLDMDQSWQTQAKALSVIEALLNEDCHEIAEYFTSEPEKIINLSNSKLRAVRIKADKVYETLGLSKLSNLNQTRATRSSSQAPDLLDFPSKVDVTVDLLELSPSTTSPTPVLPSQDPLEFLVHYNDSSIETPSTSFPFISANSGQMSSQQSEPPFFTYQTYVPLSDSNSDSLRKDVASDFRGLSFLESSNPGKAQSDSQHHSIRAVNGSGDPIITSNCTESNPVSSFSFVSQASSEKTQHSEKPLDPFANAIKTVRKNEAPSRDSFSFVQDMMKGSSNSR